MKHKVYASSMLLCAAECQFAVCLTSRMRYTCYLLGVSIRDRLTLWARPNMDAPIMPQLMLSGLQNLAAPEVGPSMRSGRVSRLTERFSQYKSQNSEPKAGRLGLDCDAELADVAETLCGLSAQQ